MKFNADQRQCIECDGNLLIVAPPGSGKTGTLVAKAARILENPASRVAMVTFTDAAAREMRHRIAQEVGKEKARRASVETFHKHAILQLRASGKLGRLISPKEQIGLVLQAIAQAQQPMAWQDALKIIEDAKSRLEFTGTENELIEAYQSSLTRFRANDLMDILRMAVVGMRSGAVKPLNVTHLLGDEFQDADRGQLEWIMAHGANGAVLTCVGDDDQAIYSFRGSMGYAGMMEFRERANAKHINLQVNYRSRLEIIQASQAVIVHNAERVEKTVLCARGEGGSVHIARASSMGDEADTVVSKILEDIERDRPRVASEATRIIVPKGSWAVIARTNQALVATAIALRSAGIAYSRPGGKDVIDGPFRTYLLLLSAIQTSDGLTIDNALEGMGFTRASINMLHDGLRDEFGALLEGVLPDLSGIEPEVATRLRRLAGDLFPAWREGARRGHYRTVAEGVADHFLKTNLVPQQERDEFSQNVRRLQNIGGSLQSMVAPFLDPRTEEEGSGVVLHTMHSSKGLEYDNVAVVRCNQGTIPSPRNAEHIDEERRLFYVAMTRARKNLLMTWATGVGQASAFLGLVPVEG